MLLSLFLTAKVVNKVDMNKKMSQFLWLLTKIYLILRIMNVEEINAIVNVSPNLSTALGMEFLSTPEDDTCMARMRVDERNRQPFGFLSGGASLALAENVAGVGSTALCPGCACVGIEVSGSHVKAVLEGDTVTAYARLTHKGTTLHVWNVEIKDTEGDIISTVRVTNYIIKRK